MVIKNGRLKNLMYINIVYSMIIILFVGFYLFRATAWMDLVSVLGDLRKNIRIGKSKSETVVRYFGHPDLLYTNTLGGQRMVYFFDPICGVPGVADFAINDERYIENFSIVYGKARIGK